MAASRSALIIASDTYQDPELTQLRAPGRDAEELAAVLQDQEVGGFDVRTLLNASHPEVLLALEDFFAERGPDDLLLLHFSCHGIKDDAGRLFFAATDTRMGRLNATAIATEYVNGLLNGCRSRHIVLMLDCCYSGAFTQGMRPRGDRRVGVKERFQGRGRAVLTASNSLEYAWEGDTLSQLGQPSIFTSAVVRALRTGEADRDQDGYISVDELYEYVFDEVKRAAPQQTPGKWSDVEGALVIARSVRKPPPTPDALPPELLQAVKSPFAGIREAAILELGRLLQGSGADLVHLDFQKWLAAVEIPERLDIDALLARVRERLAGQEEVIPGTPGDFEGTPVVGHSADGRLELFVRGRRGQLAGHIWHIWQTSADGWSNWVTHGGSDFRAGPAVGAHVDGRLAVFAIGRTQNLMYMWQTAPNNGWSNWDALGGVFSSTPASGLSADGRLEVFIVGRDGRLQHVSQTAVNNQWSGWAFHGGDFDRINAQPTLAASADGRLGVFIVGQDKQLYQLWQTTANDGWSELTPLGGDLKPMAPAVISNADGRLEVFAVGSDGTLSQIWQTTPNEPWAWAAWRALESPLTKAAPAVARNADGRLELFLTDDGGYAQHLWQASPGGGWTTDWVPLDSSSGHLVPGGPMAAAANGDGRLELFAYGQDGQLYHISQTVANAGWSKWDPLGVSNKP